MPKNVIVVGLPRSGTSMTSRIFIQQGYFVADDEKQELMEPNQYNPLGFWEAAPLVNANSQLLMSTGFKFDNTWMYEPISQQQADAIPGLVHRDEDRALLESYNKKAPWIWKDPRLCYTLGYWWPLIDPQTTGVLFLTRKPSEIYHSFIRLKWREPTPADKQDTYKRIEQHLAAARAAIEKYNIPYIDIDYSDYVNDAEATARRIGDYFGLQLTAEDIGYTKKLNNSGLRGRLSTTIDRIADRIPDKLRKAIKKLLPSSVMKMIFPNRYKI